VGAVGFEWAKAADVVDKIEEEVAEVRQAVSSEGVARTEEEMGDLLFAIANLARRLGIDSESARAAMVCEAPELCGGACSYGV
jgi:uncharacterized protein YabN with tetrapyrrole methylase and pyrophosphatase domain